MNAFLHGFTAFYARPVEVPWYTRITPHEVVFFVMPRSFQTLTLDDAKAMIASAEAKASSLGIAYNIAVVDAGGRLIAFVRQDGALIGSINLSIHKALTARIFDKTTAFLSDLAQPGSQLYGIQNSHEGDVVIFGGGIPVVHEGQIIGAVGTSAGTVEQDIAVAEAALAAVS
ncbi:GlcG/HbpS family heme-binding protein [Luteibacter sp. E-22]|uniref:GlcG/HbpS family heme-binding protein n=1 Tax=Luteibacter sp. E-22 TaxID=3404050 RepID=UPI003CE988BC